MAASKLTKLPKGKLQPVVVRKEIVEVQPINKVVTIPTVERYNEVINPAQVIEALKADPDFLKKIKGEKGEKGDAGLGAGGEGAVQRFNTVNYIQVTGTEYHVTKKQLISGVNVIGVNSSAPTTIYLPKRMFSNALVYVNDESGNASTNNITVRMEP